MVQLGWPLSHIDEHLFGGKRVLFVMAAEVEYGEALRSLIQPLFLGIGPVEAALGMGIALQSLAYHNKLPELVVSVGSAGSRSLPTGEVYQISSVSWRDMDATALGFPKGVTPLTGLPAEIPLPTPFSTLPKARLSTGGNIVSGTAYDGIDADMVDMETFALFRSCQRYNIPLIGLRGVSDGKDELHQYTDWTHLLPLLDKKLAVFLKELEKMLEKDGLDYIRSNSTYLS